MKNVCKLHLCIIGSTNFGKSSIAASLIHIAATTDGSIHLLGSPTKILKMADDLAANGQHVATGWDDIAKFQFQLQGNAGKSWQISLHDYPGALFAKYVERPSFAERMKNLFFRKAHTTPDLHVFDPTAERKASKLIAKLERADALIVLVPADVGDAKYGNDHLIYKQKLPEFIEKVLKNRPYTPVCLCINKWDMFDCGVERLEDKLKEAPFHEFYLSLKSACGGEPLCAAISAFGHHDPVNKEKIDKNQEQKPLNVLETLLTLADQAEKARSERCVETWQHSRFWKKTLVAPFRMTALLNAGSTDKNIRAELVKITVKAWGFFALFILTTGSVVIGAVTAGLCINETIGFAKLQNDFAEYEKTPYLVEKQNVEKAYNELNRKTMMRKLFFTPKMVALHKQLDEIEKKYNADIVNEAKNFCKDNDDLEPWADPVRRERKAKERKVHLEKAKGKLTLEASIHELDELITKDDDLSKDLSRNKDFYGRAYRLVNDNDEATICRRIRSFIDENKSGHPKQNKLFKELEKALDKKEKNIAGKLERSIKEYQNSHPQARMTAAQKAELDHDLIVMIDKAEKQFVEGSKNFKPFTEMRAEFSKDEKKQKIYGPFDEAYNELDKNNLKEVVGFLSKYTKVFYPNRAATIESLRKLKQSLTDEIHRLLNDRVKQNPDNPGNAPSERISNCEIRIKACQDAIDKLVAGSDELRKVAEQKQNEENKLQQLEKYQKLDTKMAELFNGDGKGKIRRIEAFLKEYHQSDYPDVYFQEKFAALEKLKMDLLNGRKEDLKVCLEQNKEDRDLSAKENVQRAKTRASAYEKAKKEYAEGSPEWKKANDGKREADRSAREWEPYVAFEEKFDEIKDASEYEKLKKIDAFLKTFKDSRQYPLRKDRYGKIADLKKETEETLKKELGAELGKLLQPGMKDFSARIEYYEQESKIFGRFRDYYPEGSAAFVALERRKSDAIEQKGKYIKWNELHQRAEQIKRNSSNAEIVLPMIRNFFNDFPMQQNAASEIETDIKNISDIQSKAVAEICKKLDEQLDGYKLEDCNDTKSEQEVYSNSCRIIEDKLDYLAGTDQYTIYKNRRDEFFAKLDRSKREEKFSDALEKLKGLLNSNMLAQEKIERIDRFEADYSADFKSKRAQEFRELAEARKRYTCEVEWAKIDEDLVRSDETDVDSLIQYREKCESLVKKAQQYKEDSYLKFKVEQKCNKAKDEIRWVEKQIGDGTFADIRKKEKEYKNEPSEENYNALMQALKAFNPEKLENKAHKEKVEDIRKRSEGYHGIVQKFNRFVDEPTKNNWLEFFNEVEVQRGCYQGKYSGYPEKYFNIAQTLNHYVNNEIVVITLKSWNFKYTKFYKKGVKNISCKVFINNWMGNLLHLFCDDIYGGNWDKDDPSYNQDTPRNLYVTIPIKCITSVKFKTLYRSWGIKEVCSQQIQLNIYEILVKARETGECLINLYDSPRGIAHITLRFSGLPRF